MRVVPWLRRAAAAALLALAANAQHNVLVVVADDLGVDQVTCFGEGSAPPPTPTIDSLAAQGILFRNAWAYPVCSPTRAAILTGRHPFRTLVGRYINHENNTNPRIGTVREREFTLPELLDLAHSGYSHAAFGKWHMHDITFGNDAPITLGGYGSYTGALTGQLQSYTAWPRVENGVEHNETTYATTKTTDDALAWIQAQTGPWLCYLAYNAPHIPFHAPPANLHTRTLTSTSNHRELYKAMIEALDTELGRLLTTLGPGVVANTHILFLGDNGSIENMAEPPFDPVRAKNTPYEGGVNVPLLYMGPAAVQPGREVTALACAVDVFATVLELAGATGAIPPWVRTDGVSMVPYLIDPLQPPLRTFAYAEQFIGNTWPDPNTNGTAIVRNDRFKLIWRYSGSGPEMYDLVADPWENQNLLAGTMTAVQMQNYAALLNEFTALRTPPARTATFGTGCAGSTGTPTIGATGTPGFGGSYEPTLQGAPPSTFAVLATGLSSTRHQATDLPLDLASYGAAPGCTLWVSLDLVVAALTDAQGTAARTITIPAALGLMEQTLLHEWFVFDPAAPQNPIGLVTTGGLAAVIGN